MVRLRVYFLYILATTSLCNAVKINMQGSFSLGKDVMETLGHYLKRNALGDANGRRSGDIPQGFLVPLDVTANDRIKWLIFSANICKDIDICKAPMGDFIQMYIHLQASAIENILRTVLTAEENAPVLADQIASILPETKKIIKETNLNINDETKDTHEWIDFLKRICVLFQTMAVKFVEDKLDGDPREILTVKKKMKQKLIIATVLAENKYEKKLCAEQNICEKDFVVTKAFYFLLSELKDYDNNKSSDFIRAFYEATPEQTYYFINSDTLHELQVILSDLSYTVGAPAHEVLSSLHHVANARLKTLTENAEVPMSNDQKLVQTILSDMDLIYHSHLKSFPFEKFQRSFTNWLKDGDKFTKHMRNVTDVLRQKVNERPEMMRKLENQAKVFLELTVDP